MDFKNGRSITPSIIVAAALLSLQKTFAAVALLSHR